MINFTCVFLPLEIALSSSYQAISKQINRPPSHDFVATLLDPDNHFYSLPFLSASVSLGLSSFLAASVLEPV